jgi:hypothetical protein
MALVKLDHFDLTPIIVPSRFRAVNLGENPWKKLKN